jgi:dTMP kinase
MARRGRFIAIEGTNGSGKGTQTRLLVQALRRRGKRVRLIAFPQYRQKSAAPIEAYLNGDYGPMRDVGPYQAALLYAVDRAAARTKILAWLASGDIVIADRFTASNLAYGGAQIKSAKQRLKFWRWLEGLEYELLELPRPDRTIVLSVPVQTSHKLVLLKKARAYLRRGKRDIQEKDRQLERRVLAAYQALVRRDRTFRLVNCAPQGKLLGKLEIRDKVVAAVRGVVLN